jgi:hypothetical protein
LPIWFLAFLLAITCVSNVQMGHPSSFQTFKFQELSNAIRNSSIKWVLTLAIVLWRFKNPSGVRLPKWEFTWECEGSILTLPYSQPPESMNCDSRASLLARTFVSLCLGCEPKARVTTGPVPHINGVKCTWYVKKNCSLLHKKT